MTVLKWQRWHGPPGSVVKCILRIGPGSFITETGFTQMGINSFPSVVDRKNECSLDNTIVLFQTVPTVKNTTFVLK